MKFIVTRTYKGGEVQTEEFPTREQADEARDQMIQFYGAKLEADKFGKPKVTVHAERSQPVALPMWLVAHESNGDNFDLFVVAKNVEEAGQLWSAYYGDMYAETLRIFKVPTPEINEAHAIPWDAVDDAYVPVSCAA